MADSTDTTDTENEAGSDWDTALAEQSEAESSGDDADWGAAMDEQASNTKAEQVPMQTLVESNEGPSMEDVNLDVILDIPVNISMEVGSSKISIRNLLKLNQGSVVELDRLAGEPLDVMVNGTLIAHGEVVVVNEKYGIRLTDVISAAERIKKLQ